LQVHCENLTETMYSNSFFKNAYSYLENVTTGGGDHDNALTSRITNNIFKYPRIALVADSMEQHYHQSRLYHHTDREDDTLTTTEFRLTLDASQLDELKNTFAEQNYMIRPELRATGLSDIILPLNTGIHGDTMTPHIYNLQEN